MRVVIWIAFILSSVSSQDAGNNVNQQPPAAAGQKTSPDSAKLVQNPACQNDIQLHCKHAISQLAPGVLLNDMAVLECLQDAGFSDQTQLNSGCAQAVWEYKISLTQDNRFTQALLKFCEEEVKKVPELGNCAKDTRPGYALSCVMDLGHKVEQNTRCFQFLVRTERLAFSDFRLIAPFVEHCAQTVSALGCGTLTKASAHQGARYPHSQGQTLECLIDKMVNIPKEPEKAAIVKGISNECRREVMRIAELQSEDFHMDRPLYFACRADRERFCSEIPAGEGKVFQCLVDHKEDKLMEPACAKMLSERAGLMGMNYHLAQPLLKGCGKELAFYRCLPQAGFEKSLNFHLSWVLLCLENGKHHFDQRQHEKQTQEKDKKPAEQEAELLPFTPECLHEMTSHRQMMVQEFRMSPELVMGCAQEIDRFCSPKGDLETEGKTIHCLMQHAESRDENKKLGAQCMAALQQLVKVADIATNYKVDKVLYASCRQLIDGKCQKDLASESSTLTCLMNNMDGPEMSEDCEQRLIEVQYFMARDWTLDPQLYDACHREAVQRCSAFDDWHRSQQGANPEARVDPGPQVLACLYRSAFDEQNRLTPDCEHNVHRVMRERAARVNLLPDVEERCRDALSEYCSHNVRPQEEMKCLQDEFEKPQFREHHPKCYDELYKFTQMESKDTKLNRLLTRACRPVIDTYCAEQVNQEIDHGDVMQCLVVHKDTQEMTPKCRSYVQHFELVSMRDYHFNYRFTEACQSDITDYCGAYGADKGAIIRCLSNIVFEHRVLGEHKDLKKECKKQLRVAFLQQEQVDFDDKSHMNDADPELMQKCDAELQRYDCRSRNTFEEVVECLREKFDDLTAPCKALVFARQKVEAADNSFDVELHRLCKFDIGKFCNQQEGERVLDCLSNSKIIRLLQKGCQKIVTERLLERNEDDRLNPGLIEACRSEAQQYCAEEYQRLNSPTQNRDALGPIIATCLRSKYAQFSGQVHLGPQCKDEVAKLVLESEFDVQLDPLFYKACKATINRHCANVILTRGGNFDSVLECLKADFYTNQIQDRKCAEQLIRRTKESLVDIHMDPSLHEACSVDIGRLCRDVPPGQSRIITCLIEAMGVSNVQMSSACRTKLTERRKLWDMAHDEYKMELPESWSEFYEAIINHPHKLSLLTYLGLFLLIILCVGCCCGRLTKRTHQELKNR